MSCDLGMTRKSLIRTLISPLRKQIDSLFAELELIRGIWKPDARVWMTLSSSVPKHLINDPPSQSQI